MTDVTFQQRYAIRRNEKRVAACLLAFGLVTALAIAAHFILGGDPDFSNDPAWVHKPIIWIWALVGWPVIAVVISAGLPMPAGLTLMIDSRGIRFSKNAPTRWKWSEIDRVEYYHYPGKSRLTGPSFIRVVFHKGKPDKRIRDAFETPLNDISDQVQSAHRSNSAAAALAPDPNPAAGDAAIFDGDREKRDVLTGYPFLLTLFAWFVVEPLLGRFFDFPRWLDIGLSIAFALILLGFLIAGLDSFLKPSKWRLTITPVGLSFERNGRQAHLSWSDIADIRVHGRTGSRAPRRLTVGMQPNSRTSSIGRRFRALFDRSRLVIPDAFFASIDEIADRMNAYRAVAEQAKS